MKSSGLKFICLSLIVFTVGAAADERPKRTGAAIPPNIHARIIQLEDERNLNGDELTGLLKHRSAAVRERAALAVGRIGDKRGTDALIAMLEHEGSEPARATAAFALGEMEDARGVSALMAVVEREKESLSARARAVESLGKIAGVQANADALGKIAVERINQSLIAQLPGSQTSLEQKPLTSLTIAALMRIRSPASVEPLARLGKKVTARIHTAKGRIRIELFPQDAPITTDSFITLARKGFFNGLTFHRVAPNFVIQGGDPRGDGEGGPGYQIRCEINTRPYGRGAVGMALSGKDTGGSQFFITHSPQPHLDGGYTVFGQVVGGMGVVDRIARGDVIRRVEIFESR